jgi:hypothetical protein
MRPYRPRLVTTVTAIALALFSVSVLALLFINDAGARGGRSRLHPGALVRAGDLSLEVPTPGHGVWAAAISRSGGLRSFGISTRADGTVEIHRDGGASPGQGTRTSPSACSDSGYTLYSTKWTSTYKWWFRASTTPSGISQDSAADALKSAATNITTAHNDCGLADQVSATHAYQGTTTKVVNIDKGSTCLTGDGSSVVSFGTLNSSYLALTCWWTSGTQTTEADMKINKASYSWYVTKPSGCSNKYDIEDVATHEFGHAFGLGHVDEATHGNLTMSPVIGACQNAEETLGLGDVDGLEAKY